MRRPLRKTALGSILLAGALLAVAVTVEAQQQKKIPRIGYLAGFSTITYRSDAFRQGLRQIGYVEGKDIVIESRSADGKLDRLNELANELVRLKVDVIVTRGPPATRAATVKLNCISYDSITRDLPDVSQLSDTDGS